MGKIQPREIPGRAAKRFKAQKIADFVSLPCYPLLFKSEHKFFWGLEVQ